MLRSPAIAWIALVLAVAHCGECDETVLLQNSPATSRIHSKSSVDQAGPDISQMFADLNEVTLRVQQDLLKIKETMDELTAATATGAAAETPHFSSRSLESSAASITVNADNSSTIFSRSAILITPRLEH